ncbi:MAG: ankyrin repeat domain-containing protein, partial [Sandaracinaceae bacterium]
MGFWSRLFGTPHRPREPEGRKEPRAKWLTEDDPSNPFGVPLLDLTQNLRMTAFAQDPFTAQRAVGWRPGMQRDVAIHVDGATVSCELRYPAGRELAEGLLYRPSVMEDKWVVAYRDGHVALARSWTGETVAAARAAHVGETLVLTALTHAGLDAHGDPVRAFDWLVRAHALGARIPLPVSVEGGERLASSPQTGFSLHGRQLFCAAVDHDPGVAKGQLASDGDLARAVADGDARAVDTALAAGAPVNAPTTYNHGAPVLHLAIRLHPRLVGSLLDAGADAARATFRGSTPTMAAAAADADRLLFERLLAAGAELEATDDAGFTAAHVAAQFGNVGALETLAALGASLVPTTTRGLTPLHVATGAGRRAAVEWLLDRGLDPRTPSSLGDPLAIAEAQGHEELARLL